MSDSDWLTERFEEHRPHLRAAAYRMLGSVSEADDAVQEAWLRLSRSDERDIDNLGGWLTTVVARICLNMLRSRRREQPPGVHVPDPIVSREDEFDPEHEALVADSVGLALLVAVLDPDVVLRSDGGAARPAVTAEVHGARAVAERAMMFARLSPYVRPALINGAAGVVVAPHGRPFSIMGFTVAGGRIVAIDALGDPERLARLDLTVLDPAS